MTRSEVADALGASIASVRRLEARQALHPQIGAAGVRKFDRAEVEALRAMRARVGAANDTDNALPSGTPDRPKPVAPPAEAEQEPPPAAVTEDGLEAVAPATPVGKPVAAPDSSVLLAAKVAKLEARVAVLGEGLSLLNGIVASAAEVAGLWGSVDALAARLAAVERRPGR